MKNSTITRKQNILAASIILALTGCGGSSGDGNGGGTGGDTRTSNLQMSGAVVDGYLVSAVVCLDLNNDGYCQIGTEPATSTDENGRYTLPISQELIDSDPRVETARIIVFDGEDSDSGRRYEGKLFASQNPAREQTSTEITASEEIETINRRVNVSAFTALASNINDEIEDNEILEVGENLDDLAPKEIQKRKIERAQNQVRDILDLPESIDVDDDPIEVVKRSDINRTDAANFVSRQVAIHRALETVVNNAGTTTRSQATENAFRALATTIKAADKNDEGQRGVANIVAAESTRNALTARGFDSDRVVRATQAASVTANQTERVYSESVDKDGVEDIAQALQSAELAASTVVATIDQKLFDAPNEDINENDIITVADEALAASPITTFLDINLTSQGVVKLTDVEKAITNDEAKVSTTQRLTLLHVKALLETYRSTLDSNEASGDADEIVLVDAITGKIQAEIDARAEAVAKARAINAVIATIKGFGVTLTSAEEKSLSELDARELVGDDDKVTITEILAWVDLPESIKEKIESQQAIIAAAEALIVFIESNGITLDTAEKDGIKKLDVRDVVYSTLDHVLEIEGLPATVVSKIETELGRIAKAQEVLSFLSVESVTVSDAEQEIILALDFTALTQITLEALAEFDGMPQTVVSQIETLLAPPPATGDGDYTPVANLAEAKALVGNTNAWFSSVQDLKAPFEAFDQSIGELMTPQAEAEMEAIGYALGKVAYTILLAAESLEIQTDTDIATLLGGDSDGLDNPDYAAWQPVLVSATGTITNTSGSSFSITGGVYTVLVGETQVDINVSTSVTLPDLSVATTTPTLSLSDLSMSVASSSSLSAQSALVKFTFADAVNVYQDGFNDKPLAYELDLSALSYSIGGLATIEGAASSAGVFKYAQFGSYDIWGGEELSPSSLSINGLMTYGTNQLEVTLSGQADPTSYEPYASIDFVATGLPENPADLVDVTLTRSALNDDGNALEKFDITWSATAQSLIDSNVFKLNWSNMPTSIEQFQGGHPDAFRYTISETYRYTDYFTGNLITDTWSDDQYFTTSLDGLMWALKDGVSQYGGEPGVFGWEFGYYDSASETYVSPDWYKLIIPDGEFIDPEEGETLSGQLGACVSYDCSNKLDNVVNYEAKLDETGQVKGIVTFTLLDANAPQVYRRWFRGLRNVVPYRQHAQYFDVSIDGVGQLWSRYRTPVAETYQTKGLPAFGSKQTYKPRVDWAEMDVKAVGETSDNYRKFNIAGSIEATIDGALAPVTIGFDGNRQAFNEGTAKLTIGYNNRSFTMYGSELTADTPTITFVDNDGRGWELVLAPATGNVIGSLKSGGTTYGTVYKAADGEPRLYVEFDGVGGDGTTIDLFTAQFYVALSGVNKLGGIDLAQATPLAIEAKDVLGRTTYTVPENYFSPVEIRELVWVSGESSFNRYEYLYYNNWEGPVNFDTVTVSIDTTNANDLKLEGLFEAPNATNAILHMVQAYQLEAGAAELIGTGLETYGLIVADLTVTYDDGTVDKV
ncbi:MAG: hypothetical protein IBX55_18345, partial [Methyloprofundus sp.]|nr:hypothetical protein [Methyloprofundus sp.]